MECRSACGACCIAPSISQAFANMPNGKPAGVACANLNLDTFQCRIWETESYPHFCRAFKAEEAFCRTNREEALQTLRFIEQSTA